MTGEIDWPSREALVRSHLDALAYLIGEWEGEGHSHGRPTSGRLIARFVLDATFIEVRETLTTGSGTTEQDTYDDLALYRFDADDDLLRVTHFQAPSHVTVRDVKPQPDGGHHWAAGPLTPRVELHPHCPPEGCDTLRVEVWMPFRDEPDVVMNYRKA